MKHIKTILMALVAFGLAFVAFSPADNSPEARAAYHARIAEIDARSAAEAEARDRARDEARQKWSEKLGGEIERALRPTSQSELDAMGENILRDEHRRRFGQ
jgi:hypothetical protein